MNPVHITRNAMAVARVQLVGGRFDGRTMVAVLGAPIAVPVVKKKKSDNTGTSSLWSVVWQPYPPLPDWQWKEGKKEEEAPVVPPMRVAVYAPRFADGNPTQCVDFVEELEYEGVSK